jgi:hypothetical protein
VRDELIREEFARTCSPRYAFRGIVDMAARGVEIVRSPARHRCAAGGGGGAAVELSAPLLNLKVTERSRVIADLSMTMARLVPVERQAFGLSVRAGAKRSQRWYEIQRQTAAQNAPGRPAT